MSLIPIAAAQYPIEDLKSWAAYHSKITRWVEEAAGQGARLLVFPEYGAMELAAIDGAETACDLSRSAAFVSDQAKRIASLHWDLAARFGVFILGASLPIENAPGRFRNVARLYGPQGGMGEQEKLIMTRFEAEAWVIEPGTQVRVFDTALGRIGIAICFDVEFPLIVRTMAEAGAEIILAPSCTASEHGYWRVRVGAQARALENQCVVVQSPTIGMVPGIAAVDENYGAAGIFGPPDKGFPPDGVLALGRRDVAQWVFAQIDRDAISRVRVEGEVLNFQRWRLQPGAPVLTATVMPLA